MIADGCKIKANGQSITPLTLNDWLSKNDGIKSDGTIDYSALEKLDLKKDMESDSLSRVRQKYKYGYYEVAVLSDSGKWYALTSFVSDRLIVNDPLNSVT